MREKFSATLCGSFASSFLSSPLLCGISHSSRDIAEGRISASLFYSLFSRSFGNAFVAAAAATGGLVLAAVAVVLVVVVVLIFCVSFFSYKYKYDKMARR